MKTRSPISPLPEQFAAIDVEIASRTPMRVCAIGIVRIESGREVHAYGSLVRCTGVIRYRDIHGIGPHELADAPPWPQVWREALDALGDIRTLVAYRASFDRAALLTMAARHGQRLPRLRFLCAADMFTRRHGITRSLQEALGSLGLAFPGRPHEPVADARAAAMLALALDATARGGPPALER